MKALSLTHGFSSLTLSLALSLMLGLDSAQAAPDMVVVAYGGAGQKAQDVALFQPFSKADGSKLIQSEYNGEMARIKVMVDTGNVDWDVVQIEGPDLMRGCDEGMYERLDWKVLGRAAELIPDAAQACGSAALVWSVAIAYDRNKLAKAPASWADFWDVKQFPGKRGLRKRAVYNLEFALLADGVKVEDVYKVLATPEGVDRAFAKLGELKPYIQWWEAGAQPAQWLAAGDVVMTSTYSGRIAAAAQGGAPLALVWPGSLYGMDYWAIIKGSKHVDQAKRFIAFANSPEAQVKYVQQIPYGPTNTLAAAQLDSALAQWVPTSAQNLAGALAMNVEFWVDHGEELEERFNAWASK
ncbi:extracellular solute-binding protein [Pseudomonas sp. Fl5BN2]|uniref:ABC transporter substrate-binding protein n=1 Tax=unclassified Pseudomonas TaxID=196821 RepID=UPI00137865E0|nr:MULTISPECIES: ABC transporter substrate-binding protein [unclassified Pseudomonas]NBF02918.1 extracellular solute-binding protein [Pseudomonas sp. Fl5BN2]NBF11740.1 extracellular solute-binding protein [Pseudomonas sp. Fl4BN1]